MSSLIPIWQQQNGRCTSSSTATAASRSDDRDGANVVGFLATQYPDGRDGRGRWTVLSGRRPFALQHSTGHGTNAQSSSTSRTHEKIVLTSEIRFEGPQNVRALTGFRMRKNNATDHCSTLLLKLDLFGQRKKCTFIAPTDRTTETRVLLRGRFI